MLAGEIHTGAVHPRQLVRQPQKLLRKHRLPPTHLIAYRTKHDGPDPF
jgi:hypothetical protein